MGDVDGQSSLALFCEVVHDVRELEAGFTELRRLVLQLAELLLAHVSAIEHQATDGRTFTVVDVTDEYQVQVGFVFCHLISSSILIVS